MRLAIPVLIALALTSPQQRPVPQRPATAAISGVVIDASTQKPLAGAIVQIGGAVGEVVTPNDSFRGTRQITDELGRFVFNKLPDGAYTVTASKFGYFDGGFGRRSGPPVQIGPVRRITLTTGQWFRDANIQLTKPASVSGTLVDETGDPLVAVALTLYADIVVGGARQFVGSVMTTTDDRGMYRIANIPPGRYALGVPSVQNSAPADLLANDPTVAPVGSASQDALQRDMPIRRDPAYALDPIHRLVQATYAPPPAPSALGRPQVYPVTYYPSSRTLADATVFDLKAGEERTSVDIQLRPVVAFRVSGRLDAPAESVAGLSLRLMVAGTENLGRGHEQATALVGKDGAFTFLNVPNGAYTILASRNITEYLYQGGGLASTPAPGFRTMSISRTAVATGPPGTTLSVMSSDGNARFQARHSVTVSGRDVTDVIVPMVSAVAVSGHVVVDPADQRVAAAAVTADPANGDLSLGQPRSYRDQDDPPDLFFIAGVLPGAYVLRPTVGVATVKSITWNGKDYTDTPIEITGGKDVGGIVITVTFQPATLSGTIKGPRGETTVNAAVIVFPVDRALWTNYGTQPTRLKYTTASTNGSWSVGGGLRAGDYFVVAVDDADADRWLDPAFLDAASRVATRLTLAWGEAKTQALVLQDIK